MRPKINLCVYLHEHKLTDYGPEYGGREPDKTCCIVARSE